MLGSTCGWSMLSHLPLHCGHQWPVLSIQWACPRLQLLLFVFKLFSCMVYNYPWQHLYFYLLCCTKCVAYKYACVPVPGITCIPLGFSSGLVFFFSCLFKLLVTFLFFYWHTFAHTYSLTFPFLSLSHVVSIIPKNHSSFSICIFCSCPFARREHTLYLKSLAMLQETHQINNRGFCFVITKPWSPGWKTVIVKNIDSRCAWCFDLRTVVFKMVHNISVSSKLIIGRAAEFLCRSAAWAYWLQ